MSKVSIIISARASNSKPCATCPASCFILSVIALLLLIFLSCKQPAYHVWCWWEYIQYCHCNAPCCKQSHFVPFHNVPQDCYCAQSVHALYKHIFSKLLAIFYWCFFVTHEVPPCLLLMFLECAQFYDVSAIGQCAREGYCCTPLSTVKARVPFVAFRYRNVFGL